MSSSAYHSGPLPPPWVEPLEISVIRINPETEPLTRLLLDVVARDNLDVNVLGDGGEGDLEAADGGRVGAPRLHVRQPGALHFQLR